MELAGIQVARTERVRSKAEEWARRIVDLGGKNPLIHYKGLRTSTLELTDADPAQIERLCRGRAVRVGSLFSDLELAEDARKRARTLGKRFRALDEEQGLDVGRLAFGLVEVPKVGRSEEMLAPLILHPVAIQTVRQVSEVSIELKGEPEFNTIFLYALEQLRDVHPPRELLQGIEEILNGEEGLLEKQVKIFELLWQTLGEALPGLQLHRRVVVRSFDFEWQAMVEDLRGSTDALAASEIVSACAGDPQAIQALQNVEADDLRGPDEIQPRQEFLVLNADSSQHRAIQAIVSGAHVMIDGPPGTGKSQTIANFIVELAAGGKRVLFVAEKRAAILAVLERLEGRGLGHLVFDVHDKKKTKRELAAQLGNALTKASAQPEPRVGDLYNRLSQFRGRLATYVDELHKLREPWDVRFYQLLCDLAVSDPTSDSVRPVPRAVLPKLEPRTRREVEELLVHLAADDGYGWRWLAGNSVWSSVTDADMGAIERTLIHLDELSGRKVVDAQTGLARLIERAGLRHPIDFNDWEEVIDLLDGVQEAVARFSKDIFQQPILDWYLALAPRRIRSQRGVKLGLLQRWRLAREARRAWRNGRPDRIQLRKALETAVTLQERWASMSGGDSQPVVIDDLLPAKDTYRSIRTKLAAVAAFGNVQSFDSAGAEQIQAQVSRMGAERQHLFALSDLTRSVRRLRDLGLSDLLDDLVRITPDADGAVRAFDRAWERAVADHIRLETPVLRQFAGDDYRRILEQFRIADEKHRELNSQRVRYEVAANLRKTRDLRPDQSATIERLAGAKRGHPSLRRLIEENSDVLMALHPCWAMSPLVVSRALPPRELFDVVVFDEASQVPPHVAMTSIMRGRQLVVAGDEHQLPPTEIGKLMLNEDLSDKDESEVPLSSFESVLSALRGLLRRERLLWHYRSRDERLIAFSNQEIYGGDLVTFPGCRVDPPIVLHRVEATAAPGYKASTQEEVNKVVEVVLAHARHHPGESLGVVAFGSHHADRIERKLDAVRAEHSELEPFFANDRDPKKRLFVKSIETVQGDERDVIILATGYAPGEDGRVRLHMGTLTHEGGERRLNVAVTRAIKRMHVVSAIPDGTLEVDRTRNRGPKLLNKFLQTARHGGDIGRVAEPTSVELNGFELDVGEGLQSKGIPFVAQLGVVGGQRIDFALAHPDRPGDYVLALEADGASYHSRPSVRDRDRLRQTHLESMGWNFYRLWSTEWFSDREKALGKIYDAWKLACDATDSRIEREVVSESEPVHEVPAAHDRGRRPDVPRHSKIDDFEDEDLYQLGWWLLQDGLQLTLEKRLRQMVNEIGFTRVRSRTRERVVPILSHLMHLYEQRRG